MKFLLAVGILVSSQAFAQNYGSNYDYQSGNSTNWNNVGGTTYVNGYNTNTGSTWRSQVDSNGNQRGTDSNGNYWNYNSSTGTYINSGTGKICTGKGAARVCTGGN